MILYSGEIYIHAKNDGINSAIKNKKENIENNSNILIYGGKINIIYIIIMELIQMETLNL